MSVRALAVILTLVIVPRAAAQDDPGADRDVAQRQHAGVEERSEDRAPSRERDRARTSEAQRDEERPPDDRRPSIPPRPIPDYGRPPEPTDVGDALLWVPRILFLPVHLVFEYGVRVPLRWVFRTIELERLDVLFVRGVPQIQRAPEAEWWFVPIFRYDYGFQPSAGLVFRARDAARDYGLRLGLDFWGADQVRGSSRGSVRIDDTTVALDLLGSYRTDRIFHGLGWSAPDTPRARYAHALGSASAYVFVRFWRRSTLASGLRASVHRFGDSSFRQDDDVSIEQAIRFEGVEPPPGYPDGYTAVSPWARLVVDSREDRGWPHVSGVHAEVFGAWGVDAERGLDASWVRAGGSLELALEVMRDRTLRVRTRVELAEALGPVPVPFTEQIWLGGELDRMPGFLSGRLIGGSAATLGLSWRYAIWPWMDAEVFIDTGNVFAERFEDFDLERLRLSFGTALLTRDPDDFTLLLAFGTEPFVLGADVTSLRFAIAIGTPP